MEKMKLIPHLTPNPQINLGRLNIQVEKAKI